jgi:hypothetical protein
MRVRGNSLFVSLSLHCSAVLYHYRYNLPEKSPQAPLVFKKHPVFIVMNGKTIFAETNCLILPHIHVVNSVRL